MNLDLDYLLAFGEELINIPSVGGDCDQCMARVKQELEALGLSVTETNKRALIATQKGEVDEGRIICAHVDTLGAIVRRILPDGRLRVLPVGGTTWGAYEAENCYVRTRSGKDISATLMPDKASRHTYGEECTTMVRDDDHVNLRLDEEVHCPEDVLALGIDVGDTVWFEPRFRKLSSGYVKSRYLDDKICVAAMLTALKKMQEENIKPHYTIHWMITNFEEVGHGISVVPEGTTECVAVDIAIVAPGTNSDEGCLSILARDSRTPYDQKMKNRLRALAEGAGCDVRIDTPYRYGSDASVGALAGFDYNFSAFGPGTDASHHYERTHIKALDYTARLVYAYATEGK